VDAPDQEIFECAIAHELIIFTHDLDFATILAHTKLKRPSVIQARVNDPLPATLGFAFCEALTRFQSELASGAVLTILPSKTKVRILPL
jgi:predicted nuclease of predicted toxin-antitoxin system